MKRRHALSLVPVAALVLAADLAAPGWGRFPNPVFYVRFAINATRDKLTADSDTIDPEDSRLSACKGEAAPTTITEAQAAIRRSLAGKSSVVAVQSLGSPACELANGSYRWLIESGLALDIQVNEGGTIDDAALSR